MISYEILQTGSGERLISSILWDTIIIMTTEVIKKCADGRSIAELHFGNKQ